MNKKIELNGNEQARKLLIFVTILLMMISVVFVRQVTITAAADDEQIAPGETLLAIYAMSFDGWESDSYNLTGQYRPILDTIIETTTGILSLIHI